MTQLTDIFADYATDETLENSGATFPLKGDSTLVVARSGNRAYAKALTLAVEQNRKLLDLNNDASEAKSEEIMIDVLARTVLLGWSNLSFKGAELPYSVENAKKLLAVKDFRRVVTTLADDSSAYRAKLETQQGEA